MTDTTRENAERVAANINGLQDYEKEAAALLLALVEERDEAQECLNTQCGYAAELDIALKKAEADLAALKDIADSQMRTINALMVGMPDEGTTPVIRRIAHIECEFAALKGHADAMADEFELLLNFIGGYRGYGFVVAHSIIDSYREWKEGKR